MTKDRKNFAEISRFVCFEASSSSNAQSATMTLVYTRVLLKIVKDARFTFTENPELTKVIFDIKDRRTQYTTS